MQELMYIALFLKKYKRGDGEAEGRWWINTSRRLCSFAKIDMITCLSSSILLLHMPDDQRLANNK